jgi:hypothetical protein
MREHRSQEGSYQEGKAFLWLEKTKMKNYQEGTNVEHVPHFVILPF